MALLDWMNERGGPLVQGDGVILRTPRLTDHAEWADIRGQSRDFLQPWEPVWASDDLTRAAFRRRIAVYDRERELGHAWPFFIFDTEGRLVGGVTLSNVRRGIAETGTIGYWMGKPYAGRGHGTAAVKAISRYAFRTLGLHRLEAACVPTNTASRRLLEKAGFRLEGEAKAYLKINGAWANHLLFGLVVDDAP